MTKKSSSWPLSQGTAPEARPLRISRRFATENGWPPIKLVPASTRTNAILSGVYLEGIGGSRRLSAGAAIAVGCTAIACCNISAAEAEPLNTGPQSPAADPALLLRPPGAHRQLAGGAGSQVPRRLWQRHLSMRRSPAACSCCRHWAAAAVPGLPWLLGLKPNDMHECPPARQLISRWRIMAHLPPNFTGMQNIIKLPILPLVLMVSSCQLCMQACKVLTSRHPA